MKPTARKHDLVIQEVGGEILVYDLRTNKAICLNQTSALVWQNCDGKKDVLEIAKDIEKELGSNVNEELVRFAMSQLKEEGLLENKEDFSNGFKGLSRREVVKRIGLTTAIAIPVVASLVAPTAAHAQTCSGACSCPGGTPVGTACGQQTCGTSCVCRVTATSPGGSPRPGTCQSP